ncbi:MAG: amidohydrolase family protein [Clostridia bacterium]|nr:amidohydrolase family protein [Clostridia bacterium]
MAEKYRQMVLSGKAIEGLEIIDAHNHLGPYFNFPVYRQGSAESMLERADTMGVSKICVSAHAAIGPNMVWGNDEAERAAAYCPERVFAYVGVKPCSEREMLDEIEKRFAAKGFIGLKLHPGLHGVQVADNSYIPAIEYAEKHSLPVLIHTWSHADVSDLDGLSTRFASVPFIIAHMGGAPDVLDHALDVMRRRENVFGDTALSYAPHGSIEYAVKKAGAEKVIFGTDMPFYDPVFTLARVVCADIRESEIEKIVGLNFRGICPLIPR